MELKSKFSKPFTVSIAKEVNILACKIWADSENNFGLKIFFLKF